jgi:hypothetical protein
VSSVLDLHLLNSDLRTPEGPESKLVLSLIAAVSFMTRPQRSFLSVCIKAFMSVSKKEEFDSATMTPSPMRGEQPSESRSGVNSSRGSHVKSPEMAEKCP